MPFCLKNAKATYQQLVNNIFEDQIGHNMEVYVDDMLIKIHARESHVEDLEDLHHPTQISYESESGQIHLRSDVREVPQIHDIPSRA